MKRLREFNILHPSRDYAFHSLRFFRSGYYEAERIMHHIFEDCRLRGEWFHTSPEKAQAVLNRLHTRSIQ